jgi:hypothetical protein
MVERKAFLDDSRYCLSVAVSDPVQSAMYKSQSDDNLRKAGLLTSQIDDVYKRAMDEYFQSYHINQSIGNIEGQKSSVKELIKLNNIMGRGFKASMPHWLKLYELEQGTPTNALRVEQHEVGYSNNALMGTDNIQQCLAVIIRDPSTNLTALAHFDVATNPASLKDVLDKMPLGRNLEVQLVGSIIRDPNWRINRIHHDTFTLASYILLDADGCKITPMV